MDPVVRQVADLCRAQVTRCKWIIVPSHAIGRTTTQRIAAEVSKWLLASPTTRAPRIVRPTSGNLTAPSAPTATHAN
jgi:hypothetical protein